MYRYVDNLIVPLKRNSRGNMLLFFLHKIFVIIMFNKIFSFAICRCDYIMMHHNYGEHHAFCKLYAPTVLYVPVANRTTGL